MNQELQNLKVLLSFPETEGLRVFQAKLGKRLLTVVPDSPDLRETPAKRVTPVLKGSTVTLEFPNLRALKALLDVKAPRITLEVPDLSIFKISLEMPEMRILRVTPTFSGLKGFRVCLAQQILRLNAQPVY